MDAPSYLQDEARACLNLAQIEEHSEMKVILMAFHRKGLGAVRNGTRGRG
jgi:hypothetical protein